MSLSIKEVAELLSVDEEKIRTWVIDGTIPYHKVGGELCFFSHDLRDWAIASGFKVDKFAEAANEQDSLSLCAAVKRGGIFYNLTSSNHLDLIREMVTTMHLPSNIDRQLITDKVLEREKMASTSIGAGIAIPHMHQSLDKINIPVVACGLLREPVAWGNQVANIIFLPCCPNMRIHLNFLMKIATLGKNTSMMQLLVSGPPEEEVLRILTEVDNLRR